MTENTIFYLNGELSADIKTIGSPKKDGTDSSIRGCALMKFNVWSGKLLESSRHDPGRGSGT